MLVIADSSALLALAACDGLGLLLGLFQQVAVPRAVFDEVAVSGKPAAEKLREFLRSRIVEVDSRRFVLEAGSLGRGELEAMALYRQLGADRLLMDDRRARRVAHLNDIAVIGTLGILLIAKDAGLIQSLGPFVERLRDSEIYFSDRLLQHALELAGELPSAPSSAKKF